METILIQFTVVIFLIKLNLKLFLITSLNMTNKDKLKELAAMVTREMMSKKLIKLLILVS